MVEVRNEYEAECLGCCCAYFRGMNAVGNRDIYERGLGLLGSCCVGFIIYSCLGSGLSREYRGTQAVRKRLQGQNYSVR